MKRPLKLNKKIGNGALELNPFYIGKYAFVLDSAGDLVVKAEFDDSYAAAKAVVDFNKSKHEIVPNW